MGGPCIVDGQSRQELDNWFKCTFQLAGKEWPSAEHYYQATKYPGDEDHQEAIRRAPNGTHCWSLGQEERPSLRQDLDEKKLEMMYEANRAKFSQNRELRKLLISTHGPIEAQGSPFWKTWNEVLLERLREELRNHDDMDTQRHALRVDMMNEYARAAKAGDQKAMEAVTTWASKRRLPPPAALSVDGGRDAESIPWLCGAYEVDADAPVSNSMPHYVNNKGGHLFLTIKEGLQVWVMHETFPSAEAASKLSLAFEIQDQLPLGCRRWSLLCDDGKSKETSLILKTVKC
eukprot:TRINITY_DN20983_c0_g1_i3.p1 TRINITY_DN20983_c0_g1~~TRINITY_DN20983_c0_g1_i3.p1  ORF type:complete len:289 (+),score=38.50 TRINITY_DN20983_c0_g1_i3:140-1006(+)